MNGNYNFISNNIKGVKTSEKRLKLFEYLTNNTKSALSGMRQFLANESPVKMMKNTFDFTLKALFVPKTFKFLS